MVATVTILWKFSWANSALVFLDETSSYRGGRLNRFDCNFRSGDDIFKTQFKIEFMLLGTGSRKVLEIMFRF